MRRYQSSEDNSHQSFIDILLILLAALVGVVMFAHFSDQLSNKSNTSAESQSETQNSTESVSIPDPMIPNTPSSAQASAKSKKDTSNGLQVEVQMHSKAPKLPKVTSTRQLFKTTSKILEDKKIDTRLGFLNIQSDRPTLVYFFVPYEGDKPREAQCCPSVYKSLFQYMDSVPTTRGVKRIEFQLAMLLYDYPGENSVKPLYTVCRKAHLISKFSSVIVPLIDLGEIEIDGVRYNIIRAKPLTELHKLIWRKAFRDNPSITTDLQKFLSETRNAPLPKHFRYARVIRLPKLVFPENVDLTSTPRIYDGLILPHNTSLTGSVVLFAFGPLPMNGQRSVGWAAWWYQFNTSPHLKRAVFPKVDANYDALQKAIAEYLRWRGVSL